MFNSKKKELYFLASEKLYVENFHTLSEISKKYHLAMKTMTNWKQEGGWEEKKKEYLEKKQSLNSDLFDLAKNLVKNIKEDLENKVKVEPGRYYALTSILSALAPTKKYEDIKKENAKDKKGSDEAIKEIKNLLGIK